MIVLLFNVAVVQAQEIEISKIAISAEVPEEFDRDINILFEYEDDTTGLFVLKKNNEYKIESPIQVGKAKVNKIYIIGNIGQYEISASDDITIKKDEINEFSVKVVDVELKSEGESIEKDLSIPVKKIESDLSLPATEELESNDEKKIDKANKEKNTDNNKTLNKSEDNSKNEYVKAVKSNLLKKAIYTAVFSVIVVFIYLIIKYKKEH